VGLSEISSAVLTVGEERNRPNCGGNLEFEEELFPGNCFACSVREGHIFRFHTGKSDSVLFVSGPGNGAAVNEENVAGVGLSVVFVAGEIRIGVADNIGNRDGW